MSDPPDKGTKKSPKNVTLPPADSKSKIQNKIVSNEYKKDKSDKTDKTEKEKSEKLEKGDNKVDNKHEKSEKHEKAGKTTEASEKEKSKDKVKGDEQEKESALKNEKEHNEKSGDNRTDSILEGRERTESKQDLVKDRSDNKERDKDKYEKYDKFEEREDMNDDKRESSLSFKDSSTIPPIHPSGHNVNTQSSNLPPSIPSLSR